MMIFLKKNQMKMLDWLEISFMYCRTSRGNVLTVGFISSTLKKNHGASGNTKLQSHHIGSINSMTRSSFCTFLGYSCEWLLS